MLGIARTTGAAALAVALVVGAGCGRVAEKATEKAVERSVERADGVDDVDISEDGIRIEGEDGVTGFYGDGSLPEGWPDEVPTPDDLSISFSSSSGSSEERTLNLVGSTGLDGAEVLEFYKDALPDWEVEGESNFSGSGVSSSSATFIDGDRRLTVGASEIDGTTNLTMDLSGALG